MLSRLLRQILFRLIHFVIFIVVAFQNVKRYLRTKRWHFYKKHVTKSDIELILKHVPRDDLKLRHLVIIADTDQHDLNDLARVLIWSLVAGVPFVSFYDKTGTFETASVFHVPTRQLFQFADGYLEKQEEKLFIEIERNKKGVPGCIKWSHKRDLNGYTNGSQAYTVVVNIFNNSHGRETIAQCIKDIATGNLICEKTLPEFSPLEFNKALSTRYLPIPDPDVVLYTGPLCCTWGLLPWHIRLTEFIQLSPDSRLSVYSYINALCKYRKCEQRFGK